MASTSYVVLKEETNGSGRHEYWVIGEIDTTTADLACRLVANEAGTYYAVPARNWRAHELKLHQPPARFVTAQPISPEDVAPVDEFAPADTYEPEMTPA